MFDKVFFDVKGNPYVVVIDNRMDLFYLREINIADSDDRSVVTGKQIFSDEIPEINESDFTDREGNLLDDFRFLGTLEQIIEDEKYYKILGLVRRVLYAKHETHEMKVLESWDEFWELIKDRKEEVPKQTEYTLDDIILPEETKDKLRRVIKLMSNNERYARIGAKIDKGILLFGSAGTGKSRCVECMAGEMNAHFIYASGSEFACKYVGVGAENVRKLFEEARKHDKAFIFIDEIDAVGRQRGLGENTERDATLNQLLVEISKIKPHENIFLIGATNHKDLLDGALTRSGRLSTHIEILSPDRENRIKIFELYINKLVHNENIDLEELADITEDFVGADIEYICNNAGLYAVDDDRDIVEMEDILHEIEEFKKNRKLEVKEERRKIGFGC